MSAEARDAVQAALGQYPDLHGGVVVRWVVLAEVIDTDGERFLWTETSENVRAWDSVGMLTFALMQEQAACMDEEDE